SAVQSAECRMRTLLYLRIRRADHDAPDEHRRRAVRRAVRLDGLALGIAAHAVVLPRLGWTHRVEIGEEVRRDRVVGEIGHHAGLLAVLDFPERVAGELAVVALLVDAEAALPVDEHAVL